MIRMKKRKNLTLFLCLGFLLFLGGCKGDTYTADTMKDASQWTCTQGSTIMQLKNSGDMLEQSIETFTLPYDAIVADEETDNEQAKDEALNMVNSMFANLDGVEMAAEKKEDGILCVLYVDYSKADVTKLKDAGLDEMIGLADGYVSASKTLNKLEEQKFACQGGV